MASLNMWDPYITLTKETIDFADLKMAFDRLPFIKYMNIVFDGWRIESRLASPVNCGRLSVTFQYYGKEDIVNFRLISTGDTSRMSSATHPLS